MAKPLVVAFVSEVAGAIRDAKKLGNAVDQVSESADKTEDAFKESEKALRSLGIKSESVANKQIEGLRQKFKDLEKAGTASPEEIARAHKSMEMRIKRINDSIGRDTTKTWDRIVSRVKGGLGSIRGLASAGLRGGAIAAGAGVAAGVATFSAVSSEAQRADDLIKLSRSVNTSVEDLSAFAFAAEQSGASTKTLFTAAKEMTTILDRGGEEFRKYGIAVKRSDGSMKSFGDLLPEIVEFLSQIEDETQRSVAAAELLGARAGPELASFIQLGAAGLQEYTDKARRFGIVVDEEAGRKAEAFNDRLDDLRQRFIGLRAEASVPFFEPFTEIFESVGEFIDRNRKAIIGFGKDFAENVLSVVQDVIAILEGRSEDVQNQWVLSLIDGFKTFGQVMTDVVLPAMKGLLDFINGIDEAFENSVLFKLSTDLGTGISKIQNFGAVERAERNALAYAQTEEFKQFAAANGANTPVNINIGDSKYQTFATQDVANALARDQVVKNGLRPTNPSRNL